MQGTYNGGVYDWLQSDPTGDRGASNYDGLMLLTTGITALPLWRAALFPHCPLKWSLWQFQWPSAAGRLPSRLASGISFLSPPNAVVIFSRMIFMGGRKQLAVSGRVRGPEHRRTLTVRSHLARWTGEAGDPAAARDQYAALLPMQERVLGPDHPDTLTTRRNLAEWTAKAEIGAGPYVN